MLIVMKALATQDQIDVVIERIEQNGFTAHVSKGDIHKGKHQNKIYCKISVS